MANIGYIQVIRHCNHFCGFCSNPTTPYVHTFESMKLLVDDLVRRGYFGVVLTGGGSLFGGLKERLERELSASAPAQLRCKVLASASTAERRYGVWLGGSILASLGSFQQLWMSKAEYEEHGAGLINRKCP